MIERERDWAHGDPEAENLITFGELRERMTELEEIRRTADRELRTLQNRQEQIRQLEQDKQALLDDYASLMPDALEGLDAAERHRVYKMLRVEAAVKPDGSLEVSGDVISVCQMEISSI